MTGTIDRKAFGRMPTAALILTLTLSVGSVSAQDVLPFPAPPMGGKIGPTMPAMFTPVVSSRELK